MVQHALALAELTFKESNLRTNLIHRTFDSALVRGLEPKQPFWYP